ncbi:MAG: 50S ribosomal protein L25 [Candidatus Dasytiphilus stammeri]
MITLNARIKIIHGKSVSRKLRLNNMLPAIIYGGKYPPIFIVLNNNIISKLQEIREFFTQQIMIIINDQKNYVKVKELQRHSFKNEILHIDFMRI